MAHILLLYSTVDGHTREICEYLEKLLQARDNRVTLSSMDTVAAPDLGAFDKIVIGASIRYGKHRDNVRQFMIANRPQLENRPHAFFSVNAVARKPTRNTPDTNPYLKRFLDQIGWRPATMAVFAGKIDYPKYGFFDRQMIRMIMWITKGPTDPKAVVDFTDWQAVDAFGQKINAL